MSKKKLSKLLALGAVHQHHHIGRRHLGNAVAYQDVPAFTVHLKVQDRCV